MRINLRVVGRPWERATREQSMRELTVREMAIVAGGDDPTEVGEVVVTAQAGGQSFSFYVSGDTISTGLQRMGAFPAVPAADQANNVMMLLNMTLQQGPLNTLGVPIPDTTQIPTGQSVLSSNNLGGTASSDVTVTGTFTPRGVDYYAYIDSDFDGDYDRRVKIGDSWH